MYGNDEVLSIPFHVFLPSTAFTVLLISVFGVSLNVKSTVPVSDTSTPPSDPVALAWFVPPDVESRAAVYVQVRLPLAGTVRPVDVLGAPGPSQSTTAPVSTSVTETSVTATALGFATVIVPLTTAFRTVEPVCVTSTFHSTVPVSPCFMLS